MNANLASLTLEIVNKTACKITLLITQIRTLKYVNMLKINPLIVKDSRKTCIPVFRCKDEVEIDEYSNENLPKVTQHFLLQS